jgi:hypothetical protein
MPPSVRHLNRRSRARYPHAPNAWPRALKGRAVARINHSQIEIGFFVRGVRRAVWMTTRGKLRPIAVAGLVFFSGDHRRVALVGPPRGAQAEDLPTPPSCESDPLNHRIMAAARRSRRPRVNKGRRRSAMACSLARCPSEFSDRKSPQQDTLPSDSASDPLHASGRISGGEASCVIVMATWA